MYFFKTELILNKNLTQEFLKVYGINKFTINCLKKKFGLNSFIGINIFKFSDLELKKFELFFLNNFDILDSLRENYRKRIQLHEKIKTYRGSRHKAKLPVRGQRTHTNAQTRKSLKNFGKKKRIKKQSNKTSKK